jgi:hypothetical protein
MRRAVQRGAVPNAAYSRPPDSAQSQSPDGSIWAPGK